MLHCAGSLVAIDLLPNRLVDSRKDSSCLSRIYQSHHSGSLDRLKGDPNRVWPKEEHPDESNTTNFIPGFLSTRRRYTWSLSLLYMPLEAQKKSTKREAAQPFFITSISGHLHVLLSLSGFNDHNLPSSSWRVVLHNTSETSIEEIREWIIKSWNFDAKLS